jgi:hypothetical protein
VRREGGVMHEVDDEIRPVGGAVGGKLRKNLVGAHRNRAKRMQCLANEANYIGHFRLQDR